MLESEAETEPEVIDLVSDEGTRDTIVIDSQENTVDIDFKNLKPTNLTDVANRVDKESLPIQHFDECIQEFLWAPIKSRLRSSTLSAYTAPPAPWNSSSSRKIEAASRRKRKRCDGNGSDSDVPRSPVRPRKRRKRATLKNRKTKKRNVQGNGQFKVPCLLSAEDMSRLSAMEEEKNDEQLLTAALNENSDGNEEPPLEDASEDSATINENAMDKWEREKSMFDHLFQKKKPGQKKKKQQTDQKNKKKSKNSQPQCSRPPEPNNEAHTSSSQSSKKKEYFRLSAVEEACKFCDHICGRTTPIQDHLERHHEFRCETCIAQFASAGALRHHRRQVHAVQHRCDLCDKDFGSFGVYKRHLQSRMHQTLLNAQAKIYNTVVQHLNPTNAGGLRMISEEDMPFLNCVKEETEKPAVRVEVRRLEVHQGDVVDFFMQQPLLQTKTAAPSTTRTTPQQYLPFIHVLPAGSNPDQPSPPSSSNLMEPKTGTSSVSSAISCSVTMPSNEELQLAKAEALENGRQRAIDQVMQALSFSSEDVLEQAYLLGIVPKPAAAQPEETIPDAEPIPQVELAPIPPTTLTAEELNDLATGFSDIMSLDLPAAAASAQGADMVSTNEMVSLNEMAPMNEIVSTNEMASMIEMVPNDMVLPADGCSCSSAYDGAEDVSFGTASFIHAIFPNDEGLTETFDGIPPP